MFNCDSLEFLKCPNELIPLRLDDDELHSNNFSYPIINGIPWLFSEPEESFLIWATKISNYISEEESNIAILKTVTGLENESLTRARLESSLKAKVTNLNQLKSSLNVFDGLTSVNLESSTQQIHSYSKLIFRDWCWEDQENDLYVEYINKNSDFNNKRVLILGAGACGLSYKLAQSNTESTFYSVEHNPYLAFMANEIINSEGVSLTEYTPYPTSLANISKEWKVKPQNSIKNHNIILSSFPKLPFNHDSFDIIIAPWFLDILDQGFKVALSQAKEFLKKDGTFHFIGPANIHKPDFSDQFSSDEILNSFNDEFKSVTSTQKFVQYLNSPLESQKRTESVLFLSAINKYESENLEEPLSSDGIEKIKFTSDFKNYKLRNETFNRIFKHINGDMELTDLAIKLESEFGISDKESLHYARTFINKIKFDS
jgi:ubiquinone/menaquinone biosynthesis C-methylase UbiE